MTKTILHITTVHPRTDTRIFIKETRTLATYFPYKVLMMVADGKGNADREQSQVSVYDLGKIKGGRFVRMLQGPWRAFVAIHGIKPTIIHFHDPELIPLGILLKMWGYKVIYDVHEDVPRQTFNKDYIPKLIRYPIGLTISAMELFFAKISDALVPATPRIAKRFSIDKTVTVQNFPLVNELMGAVPLSYLDRPKSFVYVGGIASTRGAAEMIRALELLDDIHDARLELAGMFSPLSFERELRALPGWAAVKYHGHVGRAMISRLLSGARAGLVTLHPTVNYLDSYPVKMFEYMSASLPVIASDFPLWRKIIDGAGCGVLVNPLNPEAVSRAMRWILDNPAEAEAMGMRGRQAVEKMYNWDAEAMKLIDLYKRLLDS